MIITVTVMFLESKITQKPISKNTYVKSALIVGLISTLIVYICSLPGGVDEEISVGKVPF
jgi:hypothetical protein